MKKLICKIIICTFSVSVFADTYTDYENAIEAYKSKDYNKAFEIANKDTLNNVPFIQYLLGNMYLKGRGTDKNIDKAIEWWEKASVQGDMYAQNELGLAYLEGTGKEQDYLEAKKWLEKSANQGYKDAQFNLGSLYFYGLGLARDVNMAIQLLEKSSEQGFTRAKMTLGAIYFKGDGVKQNINKGLELLNQASNDKNEESISANSYLGNIFIVGENVKRDCKKGFSYYEKSFSEEIEKRELVHSSLSIVAYNLFTGKNKTGTQDIEKAFKIYECLALDNSKEAQFLTGVFYYDGEGTEKNEKEAMKWFEKSANQGYDDAELMMGALSEKYKESFYWFEKAAKKDYSNAQFNLSIMYQFGLGTKRDEKKAFYWLQKSALQNFKIAQIVLSYFYEEGVVVERDYKEALFWYEKIKNNKMEDGELRFWRTYTIEYSEQLAQQEEAIKSWARKEALENTPNPFSNKQPVQQPND